MLTSNPGASSAAASLDVKFIGELAGSYLLSSREHLAEDQPRIFSCRSRSVSPQMVVLEAPVRGTVGEALALKLDTLGLLKASISRLTPTGFVADLLLGKKELALIARRIDWLKRRHLKAVPDRRTSKRWLPRNSRSSLILSNQTEMDCFVIDLSTSGVAVSADVMPGVGHPVVVGAVLGRVVRRLESGFAVQFLTPQDPQRIELLIGPVKESKRTLLAEALAAAEAAYEAEQARQARA